MHVEINQSEIINLSDSTELYFSANNGSGPLTGSTERGANDLLSITKYTFGNVIKVLSTQPLSLNSIQISEKAFVFPGDLIRINDKFIKLIDEKKLPFHGKNPFKFDSQDSNSEDLFTSVTGLRSYNNGSNGELAILGHDNKFKYKTEKANDTPFIISYVDNKLTLLCKKTHNVLLNGNACNYSQLKNGDIINTSHAKFMVESPGTSSFSKYSPSHPRNMQLSEEYLETEENENPRNDSYLKENLWWISMVTGLIIIAIVLILIKNNLS